MKYLLFLLFPVSVFSQSLESVNFVSKGYYKVIVSDTLYSQHTSQKECLEQVTNLAINQIDSHCEQPWVDVIAEFTETQDSVVFDTVNVESLTLRQVDWSFQNISGERSFSYKAEAYGDSVRFEYYQNASLIRSSTQVPANGAVHDTLINPPNNSLQIWIYGYWDKWVEPFTEIVDITLIDTLGGSEPSDTTDISMATYVHDKFEDTNGTELQNHDPNEAPVGSNWIDSTAGSGTAGTADIQNNTARVQASSQVAVIDAGVAGTAGTPIEILVEWTPVAGEDNRTNIPIRYSDAENMFNVNAREPNGDIRLLDKHNDVSGGPHDNAAFSWTEGQTYEIKTVLSGDNITVYIDGTQILSHTDSFNNTATFHGIGNANVSTPQVFERFAVVDEGDGWPADVGETLEAQKGSYSITGKTADFLYDRILKSQTGSYSISGKNADLLQGYKVQAQTGSYSIGGKTADLLASRILSAETGSYAINGKDASVLVGYALPSETGNYLIDGKTADLIITEVGAFTLSAEKGSYAINGKQASLIQDYIFELQKGSYSIDGKDAALRQGFSISAEKGEYILTGKQVDLLKGYILSLAKGSYQIDGKDADFTIISVGDATKWEISANELYSISLTEEGLYTISLEEKELYIITTSANELLE